MGSVGDHDANQSRGSLAWAAKRRPQVLLAPRHGGRSYSSTPRAYHPQLFLFSPLAAWVNPLETERSGLAIEGDSKLWLPLHVSTGIQSVELEGRILVGGRNSCVADLHLRISENPWQVTFSENAFQETVLRDLGR